MLAVLISIAVCHEVKKVEKIFERKLRLFGCNLLGAMSRVIAQHANKVDSSIEVIVNNISEFFGIDQTDQLILIWHSERTVNGIHPFDSKLQSPSNIEQARR